MAVMHDDIEARIRAVLDAQGRLPAGAQAPGIDANLYDAGMTSHATVNFMLALEGEFDIEFPDELLNRSVFASIAAIRDALVGLSQS
jgi:acyl carrier protein